MARGIDIGFPNNQVWSLVANAAEEVRVKVQATMCRSQELDLRIEELKSELQALEDEAKELNRLEEHVNSLWDYSHDLINTAHQMREMELQYSSEAIRALTSQLQAEEHSRQSAESDSISSLA